MAGGNESGSGRDRRDRAPASFRRPVSGCSPYHPWDSPAHESCICPRSPPPSLSPPPWSAHAFVQAGLRAQAFGQGHRGEAGGGDTPAPPKVGMSSDLWSYEIAGGSAQ